MSVQPISRWLLALGGLMATQAAAQPSDTWNAALRVRAESVSDDALDRSALAWTTRLRLGWSRPIGRGFSAQLEAEGVVELNDRFNSGANGRTIYPLVPDARALEINQAILGWRDTHTTAQLGRQRIALANQRFIGNVGWRQNEQTFDALGLQHTAESGLRIDAYWLDRVHRINGDQARDPRLRERDLDAQLMHATMPLGTIGELAAYVYRIEDREVPAASSRSAGLRWTGVTEPALGKMSWSLEAARQEDHGNSPVDFSHDYLLVEATLKRSAIEWKAGFERLGGDGRHAFQTPLATLHAFNGWADQFLTTPALGLADAYIGVSGKTGKGRWKDKLSWAVVAHDFHADHGGHALGQEWDASVGIPLSEGWQALFKLADYRSQGHARDTRKVWLQFEWTR